jgi:hypothetical protein
VPSKISSIPTIPTFSDSCVIPEPQRSHEHGVLHACQGTEGTEREKKMLLNVSDSLGLNPFAIIDSSGNEENALAHNDVISRLCNKQPATTTFKHTNTPKRYYDGSLKYEYCCPMSLLSQTNNQAGLSSVLSSCPFKKVLQTRKYIELDDDMCRLLNDDWELRPQMRFFCSRALAGSIVINNNNGTGITVNALEVYGRSKSVDAHHERYHNNNNAGLPNTASLPPILTKYKNSWVTTSYQDNSLKLLFATKTFNALVTSSYRIDGKFDAEVGPSTVSFRLDEMSKYENAMTTQVYIDKESWNDAIELAKDEHTSQLRTYNNIYQLRQVRSKFYSPTTYTLCRSSSAFVDDHTAQPLTIFTYANLDDGNNKTESDGKICSLLFKMLALQVIKHQDDAVITIKSITKLQSSTKEDKKVWKILENIVNLFDEDTSNGEDGTLKIIGNRELDHHLKELADILPTYLTTGNKAVSAIITQRFKSFSSM